jgi:hypothetical protein
LKEALGESSTASEIEIDTEGESEGGREMEIEYPTAVDQPDDAGEHGFEEKSEPVRMALNRSVIFAGINCQF